MNRNFTEWFDTFIEEKNELYKTFEVEVNEETHFISNETIFDLIRKCTPQEQAKIKDILVKIDFKNGDINHFFTHLAKGYILTNYYGIAA